MNWTLFLTTLFTPLALAASPVLIDALDPTYDGEVLFTNKGVILSTETIRIQAKCMEYNKESGDLTAEGSLLILHGQKLIVGKRIHYNIENRCGYIEDGLLASDPWFIDAKKVVIHSNGSLSMEFGTISPCESAPCDLALSAECVSIDDCGTFHAKDIRLSLFQHTVFWLPSFSANLDSTHDIPIEFFAGADYLHGPRAGLRYHAWDWGNLHTFLRLEYSFTRGLGGGIDTEYCTKHTSCYTNSFAVHDRSYDDPSLRVRYRFQGIYDHCSPDDSLFAHATYDVLSDTEMASDYANNDFLLDTGKFTELFIASKNCFSIIDFTARPRVNCFQTVNQELPSLEGSLRPIALGKSGIIADSRVKAGYQSYAYATGTPAVTNFQSSRIESDQRLYRPFHFGDVTLTPEAGIIGIYYGNNPQGRDVFQGVGLLGAELTTHFYRTFGLVKHVVEPYVNYRHFAPSLPFQDHFLFSIEDSPVLLDQLTFGLTNSIFEHPELGCFARKIYLDLWAHAFFDQHTLQQTIPRAYTSLTIVPFVNFTTLFQGAWNFETNSVDYTNLSLYWAIDPDFALGLDLLHRGPRAWRKADLSNFFLDVFRTEQELLLSPLSDRRSTVLTHLFYRLNPNWNVELQTRHGWDRINEPPYNEYRVAFGTFLPCNLILKFSFEHLEIENRFGLSLRLGEHLPRHDIRTPLW